MGTGAISMRPTGRAEAVLGACIALTFAVGLGAVVLDDGDGHTTSNAAAARRSPASTRTGAVVGVPTSEGAAVDAPESGSTTTATHRPSRRGPSTTAGTSPSSTALPLDNLAPPTTEEPAPAPPPSDDLANELIAGVLDLVPVDNESCSALVLGTFTGGCDPGSG